jgi:hypothetical protein
MENEMQERETGGIGYLVGDWPLDPQKSTLVFIHGAGGSSLPLTFPVAAEALVRAGGQ